MNKSRSLFIANAAILLATAAPALMAAQNQLTASIPEPVPGDESTYRVVDGFTGVETGSYSRLYARREGTMQIFWTKNRATGQGRAERFTMNLGRCRYSRETMKDFCGEYYPFPLSIGKETSVDREPTGDGYSSYRCKVVDLENLALPAGRYETFRVECSGIWRASSVEGGWSNTVNFTDTHWYAALLNAEVKYATVVRGATASHSGAIVKSEVHELTSFKPGPVAQISVP